MPSTVTQMQPVMGLIRVSTPSQARNGFSPRDQRRKIDEFSSANHLHVVKYVTEKKSGFTLDRDDIRAMQALAGQGVITGVVCVVMDRAARGLRMNLAFRDEVARLGLDFYTTTRGLIKNDPESDLLSNQEAVYSQYQIDILVRASISNRLQKAREGKWVGTGFPPYGYAKTGYKKSAALIIVEDKAAVMTTIYDWFTSYPPMSLRAMADRLNKQHVPTPRGGAVWHPTTLQRLIKNPVYSGWLKYKEVLVEVPALRIVPREKWERAQSRLKENRESARRNRKYFYLVAGRLRCICGHAMYGCRAHSGTRGYRCSDAGRIESIRDCNMHYLNAERVEAHVWNYALEAIDRERLRANIAQLRADAERATHSSEQDITQQIDAAQREMRALMRKFGRDKRPAVKEAADAEIAEISARIETLKASQANAAQVAEQAAQQQRQREQALTTIEQIDTALLQDNAEQRRAIVDAIDARALLKVTASGRRYLIVSSLIAPTKRYAL